MEHVYTVSAITIVQEKSDFEKVACSALVYLTTKETFEHTYEVLEYPEDAPATEPVLVTKTDEKTVEHFQQFTVQFDTSSLDPLMFVPWEDLTEEQALTWVRATKGDELTALEEAGAEIVAEKKDRILHPKRYQYDTPVTPWRARADQEAIENL